MLADELDGVLHQRPAVQGGVQFGVVLRTQRHEIARSLGLTTDTSVAKMVDMVATID